MGVTYEVAPVGQSLGGEGRCLPGGVFCETVGGRFGGGDERVLVGYGWVTGVVDGCLIGGTVEVGGLM